MTAIPRSRARRVSGTTPSRAGRRSSNRSKARQGTPGLRESVEQSLRHRRQRSSGAARSTSQTSRRRMNGLSANGAGIAPKKPRRTPGNLTCGLPREGFNQADSTDYADQGETEARWELGWISAPSRARIGPVRGPLRPAEAARPEAAACSPPWPRRVTPPTLCPVHCQVGRRINRGAPPRAGCARGTPGLSARCRPQGAGRSPRHGRSARCDSGVGRG
jgi:hypothetical protein